MPGLGHASKPVSSPARSPFRREMMDLQSFPPKCDDAKHNWREIDFNRMVCLTCQSVREMGGLFVSRPADTVEWAGGHWENGAFVPESPSKW